MFKQLVALLLILDVNSYLCHWWSTRLLGLRLLVLGQCSLTWDDMVMVGSIWLGRYGFDRWPTEQAVSFKMDLFYFTVEVIILGKQSAGYPGWEWYESLHPWYRCFAPILKETETTPASIIMFLQQHWRRLKGKQVTDGFDYFPRQQHAEACLCFKRLLAARNFEHQEQVSPWSLFLPSLCLDTHLSFKQ